MWQFYVSAVIPCERSNFMRAQHTSIGAPHTTIVSVAYYYVSAAMLYQSAGLQVYLQNVVCLFSKTSSTYEAEARR